MFEALIKPLTQATEEDLKEWNRTEIHSKLYWNKFSRLFRNLAEAMTTRPANILSATSLHTSSSSLSDLSSSSNEDKGEEPSKNMLSELFDIIISYPGYSRIAPMGVDYDFTVYGPNSIFEMSEQITVSGIQNTEKWKFLSELSGWMLGTTVACILHAKARSRVQTGLGRFRFCPSK